MIPKKIHYCWFGGNPLPELAQKCIASWKKYCPDYEIIEWNESNFDINCCDYVREAYAAKKWAFVSDYARLYVLAQYGGIYMDTDCEVIRPLDEYLSLEAISGFESDVCVPTALMGSVAHASIMEKMLQDYHSVHFLKADGSYDLTTNVVRITNLLLEYGLIQNNSLQTIAGFTLFPKEYFCPKDGITGAINITTHTVCIHHFDGSWVPEEDKYAIALRWRLAKFLPAIWANCVAKTAAKLKYGGVKAAITAIEEWKENRK